MQTTINAHRLPKFRPRLAAGSIYSISTFDVARCAQNFRLTDSSLLIVSWLQSNWKSLRDDPKVIVATNINPKTAGGRLFLNAMSGTHIYLDSCRGILLLQSYFLFRLVARDTGLPSAAPLLRGYAKVEPVTIPELNDFIITALYRVEMVVEDDTAEGTFVCFDGEMTNLHNLRASEAGRLLAEGVNPEDSKIPPFIADLRTLSKSESLHITSPSIIRLSPYHASSMRLTMRQPPTSSRMLSHGSLTSGSGGCEASKSTGKKPVGDAHKTDATTSKVVKKACVA
ncbi:hypothetical protein Rs2_26729 [Raphanus sativus]|nr:hypothetical protein Rs2_26729 [Raphanus sativus]